MKKEKVIEKLRNDEHYYGDFGKQYLSNSDIKTLLTNPLALGEQSKPSPAFLVGGYFHTAILEPDKLKKYRVIPSSTRNTKAYKEMSGGELCLLQHEVDAIELMKDKLMNNQVCKGLINSTNTEYEVPGVSKLFKYTWKGKADVINHDDKFIVDIKTTADINKFKSSAYRYNYDSQAYIYRKLFGYEMIFVVIDKTTHQLGVFDCSDEFYRSGEDKVLRAEDAYELFFKTKDFNPKQYFISKTL
jgi:exodeoxyribonuclease VIII